MRREFTENQLFAKNLSSAVVSSAPFDQIVAVSRGICPVKRVTYHPRRFTNDFLAFFQSYCSSTELNDFAHATGPLGPPTVSGIMKEESPGGLTFNHQRAERFNRDCHCLTLDWAALRTELSRHPDGAALYRMIVDDRPHLFAESPVFVPDACVRLQARIIDAVERVATLPAFQERVLAYAPPAALFTPKSRGVFLGFDFHMSGDGPRLIEINTNAGGGLLNALLLRAQKPCGDLPGPSVAPTGVEPEETFLAMFREEWRLERFDIPLRSVAIVDEHPETQFLYPEFVLFQHLFEREGIHTVVCDPGELEFRQGALWYRHVAIDLVYNRLTDFGLEQEAHRALREAYLANAVVLTPHPRAHAIYADKRNLALLTDDACLREMGVDESTRALLMAGIAHTTRIHPGRRDALWSARKHLFFKPAAGYGSKAAYRGDKLTRRVFEEILQGDYVAQALIPPSERRLNVQDEPAGFKVDLRNYVYRGQVQLIVTRLYQGQTTNFRTPGGGFAPVIVMPSVETAIAGRAP